jgi:Ca-activated chloride channel family protein
MRTNRIIINLVIVCLAALLLSSCARVQGMLLIMEGNFFASRGLYTQAIASYLGALAHEEIVPYAEYGLAVVYFALGESFAAMERYRAAMTSLEELGRVDAELTFRIHYNMGIIYFGAGEYLQAAKAFRSALMADGGRIEAKRNLELSLLVLRAAAERAAYSPEIEGDDAGVSAAALFAYARQKEREQWRNREWASEDDWYGPDF